MYFLCTIEEHLAIPDVLLQQQIAVTINFTTCLTIIILEELRV